MEERVTGAICKATITFSNGDSIDIKQCKIGEKKGNNYINKVSLSERLSADTSMPVGVVCANIIDIELTSLDGELNPDNKNSSYYKYMNKSAFIDITFEESNEDIDMGRYFVEDWESDCTASNNYGVTISAVDLLSRVGKSPLAELRLKKNITIVDYLDEQFKEYNSNIKSDFEIGYNKDELDFGLYGTMQYNLLNAGNFSDLFNTISQSTITNMFIGRDRQLKTDYCLDDSKSDSVCRLDDTINLTQVSVATGGLSKYDGVKVHYGNYTVNGNQEVLKLENQAIVSGDNILEGIELKDNVYKINYISVISDTKNISVKCSKFSYGRKILNMTIASNSNCKATIIVYGQTLNTNTMYVERQIGDGEAVGDKTTLELNNTIISERSLAIKYAKGLLKLMKLKQGSLQVTGWINPRIQLSDIVEVNSTALNISGYYKVVELNWTIENSIMCTAKLIKTVA